VCSFRSQAWLATQQREWWSQVADMRREAMLARCRQELYFYWHEKVMLAERERDEARAEVERLTEACDLLQGDLRSVVDTLDRLDYPCHPEYPNRDEIGKRLHEMHGRYHNALFRAVKAEAEVERLREQIAAMRGSYAEWMAAMKTIDPTQSDDAARRYNATVRAFHAALAPTTKGVQ
jgi:chromosome segregation ATPase